MTFSNDFRNLSKPPSLTKTALWINLLAAFDQHVAAICLAFGGGVNWEGECEKQWPVPAQIWPKIETRDGFRRELLFLSPYPEAEQV